jgi:hypothetical protein
VNLVKVDSTNLQAVGFDKQSKTMRILFNEGAMYDYFGVPEKVHGSLMEADSLGSFFQQNIVGRYRFQKVNLEKESTQMGKNKQQRAAEERAQAAAPKAAQPAATEAPKPPAPAAAAQPSKQEATIQKLKDGWAAKGIGLSQLAIKDDGKFKVLHVTPEWPSVQVGASGGITVLELRSYTDAFTAAMEGLDRFNKQKARDAKKSVPAAAPAPAPTPAKPESTTAKKKRQDAAVEAKLETASA